ncbi:MAG: hypothetical protein IJ343_03430 [Clostridia bacterium]|nr:hypothetical protein [Clostridia bacterium]
MGKKSFVLAALLMLLLPLLLAPFGTDIRAYQMEATGVSIWDDPVGYVTDRLALRTAAVTLRSWLLSLLGESGSPQVVQGRDDFLFFADSLRTPELTDEERDALCSRLLMLEEMLAADGRRLAVLIAPDKRSVYPEKLPANVLRGPDSLSRLNAALSGTGLTVLDAQSLLADHADDELVYFRGDSHWNARGARLVYQALMELIGAADAPNYAGAALLPGTAGDLTLLCQPGTPPTEPDASPDLTRVYRTSRPMRSVDDARIQTSGGPAAVTLLVVRDSFGRGLFPYLANAVRGMTFSRLDEDVPAQAVTARADWVVIEIVERNVRDWLEDDALLPVNE